MNLLSSFFSETGTQRLGWVLLHFLWEGTIIALVLAALLRLFAKISSPTRYGLAGIALLLCALAPVVTWSMLASHQEVAPSPAKAGPVNLPQSKDSISSPALALPETGLGTPIEIAMPWQVRFVAAANLSLPYAVGCWLVGVIILSTRLTLGWIWMKRLCRSGILVKDPRCLEKFESLLHRMQIARPVRLLESALVEVPTLIGWLQPTILIPVALFAGMTPDQLAAILAHELAHVRRYDYLVNLFQTVIETILFYHPAVWWISRKLREERENCCDDIALEITSDRLAYARALAQLEERRALPPALTASGGSLLQRIKRIAGVHDRKVSAWPLWVLIIGLFSIVCLPLTRGTQTPETIKQALPAGARLLSAVRDGDAATVKKLIDQGVDLKQVTGQLGSLLFEVTTPEVAETLLAHGLEPNAYDEQGYTPLSIICEQRTKNTPQIVRVFLQLGADPNAAVGELKQTPLMNAYDGATIDLLVKYGANLKATDRDGDGVLFYSYRGSVSRLEMLIRDGVPFNPETDGPTLLVKASDHANTPVIRWLLDHGVNPNESGVREKIDGKDDLVLPLQAASNRGYLEAAKLLLARGAKANGPMVTALVSGNRDIVKFFWENGVRSVSPLLYAVSQNAPPAEIKSLLDQGTPPDPPQDTQITPLADAAMLGNLNAVKLLVASHADIGGGRVYRDPDYGMSPIALAATEGQDEIVKYLLHHGAKPIPSALFYAAKNSCPYPNQRPKEHFEKCVQLLLNAGALKGVAPKMEGSIIAASILTRQGPPNQTVLKMLLDAGANPEAPMPYTAMNHEKADSVVGHYRDYYESHKKTFDPALQYDPYSNDDVAKIRPLLDMLEAADKHTNVEMPRSDSIRNATALTSPTPAIDQADVATTSSNGTLPSFARVELKVIQINEDDYQAHRADIDAAVKSGDDKSLTHLRALDLPTGSPILIESGQERTMEYVRVFPYAVAFEKGADGKMAPITFERRDLGVRFILRPTVTTNDIHLDGNLRVTVLQGWVILRDGTRQPVFNVREAPVSETFSSGQTKVFEVPGGVQMEPLDPLKPASSDKPQDKSQNPNAPRRLFYVLTASTQPAPRTNFHGRLQIPAAAHANFAKTTGVLVADDGTRYPLAFDKEGAFDGPSLKPGTYREVIHLVCETQEGVTDFNQVFGTIVTAENQGRIELSWDPTPLPPKDSIHIELKVVEIDDDVYQAHKDKIDVALKKDGAGIIALLNNMKGVNLLSAPTVNTSPGLKATVDIVRGFPYPTSFDPARVIDHVESSGPDDGLPLHATVPATPRTFATKNLGVSAEVLPTLHGDKIAVSCTVKVTDFEGFTETNQAMKAPAFETREANLLEEFDQKGELKGALIPGFRFDEATVVDRNNQGKVLSTTKKTVKVRLMVFLRARLNPGGLAN